VRAQLAAQSRALQRGGGELIQQNVSELGFKNRQALGEFRFSLPERIGYRESFQCYWHALAIKSRFSQPGYA
jgi:hypothetical protein